MHWLRRGTEHTVKILKRLPWATCDQSVNDLDIILERVTGDKGETN